MTHPLSMVAALLLAGAALAFWPDYLARLGQADGVTHAHALLGTAWLLLLAVQPMLVARRRLALHRTLGRLGAVIGAAFVLNGVHAAHRGLVRMSPEELAQFGHFVYLPLSMALLFGTALGLGLAWRRVRAVHGRFMACTALPLLDPVLARLLHHYAPPLPADFLYQVPAFGLAAATLLVLAGTVPAAAPGRRVFQGYAVAALAVLALYFALPGVPGWSAVVQGFRALPLP